MRKLITESGIRNIKDLARRYPNAKIYFHQDLDGVTTAIGMKNYLEQYGIKVIDAEVIQYGDKEFAIKKVEANSDTMPVLVDFAHGKPMFVIHTDHHDTQAGVESGTSVNFRPSRSNVETLSQIISPKEIFPDSDISLISTVDSANFASNNITPEMVMNYLFKIDKDSDLKRNKTIMGLVTNKLLLAFKNKPGFLEEIVLNAKPSLLSILNNIKKQVESKGYANVEELVANQMDYIQKQKTSDKVNRVGNIIVQYGGGSMVKPGSYDRYTPFRNNPDADFIVIAWPLGLVQASCNPYKQDRSLKGVDLGEMKNEVLSKFESRLKAQKITFGTLKRISETTADYQSVGFTLKDMMAIYGKSPSFKVEGKTEIMNIISDISNKLYKSLSEKQKQFLDRISVNGWDVVLANSGGHKCITNISGLSFLYRKERKNNQPDATENIPQELMHIATYNGENNFVKEIKSKLLKFGKLSDKQIEIATSVINKESKPENNKLSDDDNITTYVELTKAIQNEFVNVLNDKIEKSSNITENEIKDTKKYYVDESQIQGKGVFATKDIKKGETIGLLHNIIEMGSNYKFTELGKFHNHSDNPNCHNELVDGNKRYLVATRDIPEGEELTTDYRLQSDLEQPIDGWNINESKNFKPEIDGYRTYSPFKDLEYIVVEGNGIDCDNIVYDLMLIGDNGNVKYCKKNTGKYFIEGAKRVVEIPLKENENPETLLSSKRIFSKWLEEKIDKIDTDDTLVETFFN
jgi:hypothetical protein